jgi:predicted nucleotidyltransferase
MRLSSEQARTICAKARAVFGQGVIVRLFGSRTDDRRVGGDIDLAIEIDGRLPDYMERSLFLAEVEAVTDDSKIDLVFLQPGQSITGFEAIVRRDGIVLS